LHKSTTGKHDGIEQIPSFSSRGFLLESALFTLVASQEVKVHIQLPPRSRFLDGSPKINAQESDENQQWKDDGSISTLWKTTIAKIYKDIKQEGVFVEPCYAPRSPTKMKKNFVPYHGHD
jgi:hypothetical protein